MDSHTATDATSASHKTTFVTLTVGALGVVFGDIGTRPLYTLKESMTAAGGGQGRRSVWNSFANVLVPRHGGHGKVSDVRNARR